MKPAGPLARLMGLLLRAAKIRMITRPLLVRSVQHRPCPPQTASIGNFDARRPRLFLSPVARITYGAAVIRRRSTRHPNVLLLLAALAAVLQWLVPHGWMVGSDGLLVPCPSVSPGLAAMSRAEAERPVDPVPAFTQHVAHGHHGHHAMAEMPGAASGAAHDRHPASHAAASPVADPAPDADHSGHAEHAGDASALCDFAALGAPVLLPGPPDLLPPLPPAIVLASAAVPSIVPGRGLAAPPPPSTGPPHIPA